MMMMLDVGSAGESKLKGEVLSFIFDLKYFENMHVTVNIIP